MALGDLGLNNNSEALLSIVIVNWNAGNLLLDCVKSINLYGNQSVAQIIVVDNSSSDGSEDLVDRLPLVTLIRSKSNLGFGKACNLGAQSGKSEYLLFLNPDAALLPDTLNTALAFMQNPINKKVGICGVQLKDESGHVARSCARFPRPLGFAAHALGVLRLMPQWGHAMTDWPHDRTRDVDQVIGAFFLVRRALFEQLSGFDERFFVYFEEVDFSYRAHKAGWRTTYLADAQAFHAGGGTSNQVKARRLFYSLRSRTLYAFKHFSLVGAVAVLLATLLLEPVSRSALAVTKGSFSGLKETWAAYAMLWRWLPQWIFKGVTR
jgi:GT2 family glycosyltransferase